jgi:hypothetical protein
MTEARHHERVRTILGAQIVFNNRNSTLECQVRNISSAGAKLVLSESVTLPEEFEIHIPQKGRTFRARLRWRTPDGAGIEFLRDEPLAAAVSDRNLVARVRELESENEALRARVLDLMQQLDKAGGGHAVA